MPSKITSIPLRGSITRLILDERAQHIEVVGEGLPGAPRVPDCDGDLGAGGKGEGHGHPVVVVRVDCRHVQLLWRCDDAIVRAFLHRCSQLVETQTAAEDEPTAGKRKRQQAVERKTT